MFKKLLLNFTIGVGMMFSTLTTQAQTLEQGDKAIDIYYGFASVVGQATFEAFAEGGDNSNFKYIGPIGARFEYMASEKMGVGFEFNYTLGEATWTADVTDSITSVTKTYNYKIKRDLIRFMPRFNVHFGGSESFDGYFGVAAGYRYAKWTLETDDEDYEGDFGGIPLAIRISLGGRYYFTDNIGLHMELGLGGGTLIHGGLSFKF